MLALRFALTLFGRGGGVSQGFKLLIRSWLPGLVLRNLKFHERERERERERESSHLPAKRWAPALSPPRSANHTQTGHGAPKASWLHARQSKQSRANGSDNKLKNSSKRMSAVRSTRCVQIRARMSCIDANSCLRCRYKPIPH